MKCQILSLCVLGVVIATNDEVFLKSEGPKGDADVKCVRLGDPEPCKDSLPRNVTIYEHEFCNGDFYAQFFEHRDFAIHLCPLITDTNGEVRRLVLHPAIHTCADDRTFDCQEFKARIDHSEPMSN